MDADGKNVRKLTNAPGCYNGGPFFSPDGKRVIFRSDRKKKDHLQLYVINADGTGETRPDRRSNWVYWAPYWHKDGKHIIYTAADHSNPMARPNYDLYWMNIETGKKTRLTFAPGSRRAAGLQPRRQEADVDLDARWPAAGPQLVHRGLCDAGGEVMARRKGITRGSRRRSRSGKNAIQDGRLLL